MVSFRLSKAEACLPAKPNDVKGHWPKKKLKKKLQFWLYIRYLGTNMPHLTSLTKKFWEYIRTASYFAVLVVISVKRSTYLHHLVLTGLLASCSTFPRQIHHLH